MKYETWSVYVRCLCLLIITHFHALSWCTRCPISQKKTWDSAIQASVSPSLWGRSLLFMASITDFLLFLAFERPPFWFLHIPKEQTAVFFLVWYLPTACWILFFKAILRLHPQDGNQCILFSASKQIAWDISCIIWILYSKKDWFVVNTLYCNIYYFYLIQC